MTTIKEISLTSIAEPAQIKIERGQKGAYGYEINLHGDNLGDVIASVLQARVLLEKELVSV